jgi:hypothetical protein
VIFTMFCKATDYFYLWSKRIPQTTLWVFWHYGFYYTNSEQEMLTSRVWSCKDNNVEVTMVYVKNYLKRFVFSSSSL